MRTILSSALLVVFLDHSTAQRLRASGHGPVFGLATPTNPKGGWSLDMNLMGRAGKGSGFMFRPSIGYGLTESFKVSFSAPVSLKAEPFAPSRMSAFSSMSGDFEGTAIWRFHRKDTGIGSRFESAAIGGILLPSPQEAGGVLRNVRGSAGALVGGVTGLVSRSHYAWAGATYQRYALSKGNQRPDMVFYSLAYAYRPPSWRTDTGWDWRIFAEMTGERTGNIHRSGVKLSGSDGHQVFLGPTTLGVYKNYAVSAGFQVPLYRVSSNFYPRERFRFALNFAYFF